MAFGPTEILIGGIYCCVPLVVLIGIGVGLVFLNKRLSPSSWIRKILAVVTGVIVAYGGAGVVSGIYTAILVLGRSEYDLSTINMSILIIVSISSIFSILGGYIAGKIARQNEIVYGFSTGIGVLLVSVTLTFLMGLSTKTNYQGPIWQLALNLVINLASTTLGGYLAFLQRKRKQANFILSDVETPQMS